MLVEFIGGFLSGSLALISDAGHMLTDVGALSLALIALWFSRRPATEEKTYGFYRLEILSALLNGAILVVIAGFVFYQAFLRVLHPEEVKGSLMLIVAVIGLAANLFSAWLLSASEKGNLNVEGALWHTLSDAFSSVGVIIGALIIVYTRWYFVDPIIGFILGIVILVGAWRLIVESVDILLEATPKDIDLQEVIRSVKNIPGVRDFHDLHIWTITSGMRALSAHVLIDDIMISKCANISGSIKDVIKDKFSITHSTLEFECTSCAPESFCAISRG